jgi:5-(aminomethyl)-3-furanmethanol phosphate kinase
MPGRHLRNQVDPLTGAARGCSRPAFYNVPRLRAECCNPTLQEESIDGNQCMALRVVKLGGSLLDMPGLVPRLRQWLAGQPPADTLLVIGGGALAEAIRTAQAQHGFQDSVAHWLCIRAMLIQAEIMLAILPEAERLESAVDFQRWPARLRILDPWRFLCEDESRLAAPRLPQSWDVTSDSIAARVAELIKVDELVLLKSALPAHPTFVQMSQAGYVDGFFPQAASQIERIRLVNLRDASCLDVLTGKPDSARQ